MAKTRTHETVKRYQKVESLTEAIGHAVALGLDFSVWVERTHDPALQNDLLRRGTWVDYVLEIMPPGPSRPIEKRDGEG